MTFRWLLTTSTVLLLYQVVDLKEPSTTAASYVCACRESNLKFDGNNRCVEVKLRPRIDEVRPVNKSEVSEDYTAYTFHIFDGKVNCILGAFNLSTSVDSNRSFYVSETDKLWTELNTLISLRDKICFKQIMHKKSQPSIIKCNHSEPNETKTALSLNEKRDIIILIGIVLSLPFLFLTIATYALIKELRNTFGILLMFYTVTMFINNIIITLRYFERDNFILQHFQEITSVGLYFWIHAMCFNFWRSFKIQSCLSRNKANQINKKMLILYSIFVLVGSILFIFINNVLPDKSTSTVKNRIVYENRTLDGLLLCNFLMLLLPLIKIIIQEWELKISAGSESIITVDHKKRMNKFYTKLIVIISMIGVNWLIKLVCYSFSLKYENLLLYLDFGNTIHGEMIFIIFVCKKDVFVMLKKKCSSFFN